jgi:tetratricopeptide (TPR) repeat protein
VSTAHHLPTLPNRASPSTRVSETVAATAIPMVVAGPPQVPGYEIERELGRGGMGVVYLARQPDIDRPVALKMLRAGVLADDDARVRFAEEARVVARLRHPNVVQLYEAGEALGQPYLALEYVAGPTLAVHAAGVPQPVAWAAELVESLAAAMQYAHEQGVIHRDLKPGNVLLSISERGIRNAELKPGSSARDSAFRTPRSEFQPKVADFGLAKVLGDSPVHTQSGLTAGTPGYMAPEQVRGDRTEIGPWTDVYALGVILYELLTGRTPFPFPHPTAAMVATTDTAPPSPRRFRPDIPRDLETVCLKCLAKSPRERYLTAAELAADLGRYRAGRPVLARRAGVAERAWKLARRNPVAAGLAAGLAASLVVGFVAAMVLWRQAEFRRAESEERRQRAERAEADARAALAELTARQSDLAALNTFLLDDILAAPRPKGYVGLGAGKGVTVREALDAAAAKIAGRFGGKPSLAAAAEHTVGESYRQIGEYAAAVKHLTRAVELRAGLDDAAGLAASRHRLAVALTSSGKEADALPLFRAALDGADARTASKIRRDLGLSHVRRGDTAAAIAELSAVLEADRELFGPDHAETISAINSLASAHTRANQYGRVVELGREAVRLATSTAPDGVVMAYSLNTLGTGLAKTGGAAEAEGVLAKAVEMHGRHAGADHPDTVGMAFTHARVLLDGQKWADAEDRLRATIPHAVVAFGPGHKLTCEMRMMRAIVLGRLGKVTAAETEAAALLDALRATPAPDPRDVRAVEDVLAKLRAAKAKRPVAPPPRPKG